MLRILIPFVVLFLLLTGYACAETHSMFEYEINGESEAMITGCNVVSGEIEIPAEINGYKITAIGDNAFEDCRGITGEIVIPEGVKSIGSSAFYGCWNLTGAVLPDSLENLGSMAFGMCYRLRSVDLGGIKALPYMAFAYCRSLDSIDIPESCASIGGLAFENCTNLKHILIPGDTAISGVLNRYGKASIYCYAGSKAESWAESEDWNIILLDGKDDIEYRRLSLGDDFKMNSGSSCMLPVNVFPGSGRSRIRYESSAPETISIDESGRLTAHQTGSAVITANLDNLSGSVMVTSVIPVEDFSIIPRRTVGHVGQEIRFEIKTVPENADGDVLWHSTDNSVITIGLYNGLATIRSHGTAEITALVNGIYKRIRFSAFSPDNSLILPDSLTRIGSEAFASVSTAEILLSGNVTHIESRAFADNPALRRIYMPDSLISIAPDAFAGSENVSFICESNNYAASFARDNSIPCIIEKEN